MKNPSGIIARMAVLLALNAGMPRTASFCLMAQPAPPRMLILQVIEGEGAINNIKARIAREPIVEVQDENHKPIGGALVSFTLPNSGPGGTFLNGSRVLTVTTDANGRAVAKGLRPNNSQGAYQIRVTATFQGLTATTTINQSLVAGGAAAASAGGLFGWGWPITIAAIGAVAAGTAVGVTLGLRNNGAATPTRVSVGQPSLP